LHHWHAWAHLPQFFGLLERGSADNDHAFSVPIGLSIVGEGAGTKHEALALEYSLEFQMIFKVFITGPRPFVGVVKTTYSLFASSPKPSHFSTISVQPTTDSDIITLSKSEILKCADVSDLVENSTNGFLAKWWNLVTWLPLLDHVQS